MAVIWNRRGAGVQASKLKNAAAIHRSSLPLVKGLGMSIHDVFCRLRPDDPWFNEWYFANESDYKTFTQNISGFNWGEHYPKK